MKLKLFLFLSVILITACSKNESFESVSIKDDSQNNTYTRSYKEALEIAERSISMLHSNVSNTRGLVKKRRIDYSNVKTYTNCAKTRSGSIGIDTLIYVFNFEDNEGFALVSASKRTEALLAVVDKGHCSPHEESEIQGLKTFIELAKKYVSNTTESPILRRPVGPIVETRDSIIYAYQEVGPYLSVNWGQIQPEGEFCPNGIAGCANTALAQVMSYYGYPTSINLTYPNADQSNLILNWTDMKAHATGHSRSSCVDQTTHDTIGKLLRQLGKLSYSVYEQGGTGTDPSYIPSVLDSLGYSHGSLRLYKGLVARHHLNQHNLIYMVGFCSEGGHAWILDGYKTVSATIYHLGRTATYGWFIMNTTYETNYYLHLNWGWYGDCNGYFLEGVYDTTQASDYDYSTNVHNHNFNQEISMMEIYH